MRSTLCTLRLLAIASVAGIAAAQNTDPHWSSYFGGAARDEAVVVRRGPGALVTLVGHTDSDGLATGSAFQPARRGAADVFVARFDPALPPTSQLKWCTYLGGSGLELVFDAEVDATTGVTTVVGLSLSADFPAAQGQPAPTLRGPSDGFVAQIASDGTALMTATFLGGSAHDRLCEVELSAGGNLVTVAGVTESTDLGIWLPTSGTVNPTFVGGATDAFVARLVVAGAPTVVWATHLGGTSTEGIPFANWGGWGSAWEGNLDRMGLALDGNGDAVVATTSFFTNAGPTQPPQRTTGAFQTAHGGSGDAYLAILNASATQISYGTFFGGGSDDRVKSISRHPAGGFVLGGLTASTNLPVSAGCLQGSYQGGVSDGYLAWIQPNGAGPADRLYATYFGGPTGEDNVTAIAGESSGLITFAGYTVDGGTPVTPRSLQPLGVVGQTFGFVGRLEPRGMGRQDLLHATLVGSPAPGTNTGVNGLALDPLGDVLIAGFTNHPAFHVRNAWQSVRGGGRDAYVTYLPLLPGPSACVCRQQTPFATPCGTQPLHTGLGQAPLPGTTFSLLASNAPPLAPGVLALGLPATAPLQLFNGWLLVESPLVLGLTADARGFVRLDVPIPANLSQPPSGCWGLAAQWIFLTSTACPGSGPLANSERLAF